MVKCAIHEEEMGRRFSPGLQTAMGWAGTGTADCLAVTWSCRTEQPSSAMLFAVDGNGAAVVAYDGDDDDIRNEQQRHIFPLVRRSRW